MPPDDPTAAATQTTIDQNKALAESQHNVNEAQNQGVASSTNYVQNGLNKVGAAAPMVAAAITGVGTAVKSFTAGLDEARLGGFSKQVAALGEAASRPHTALADVHKVVDFLTGTLKKFGDGTGAAKFTQFLAQSGNDARSAVKMLANYAAGVVEVGDELTQTRNAMIAQAAASGNLGSMLHMAGDDLKNFNDIAIKQQKIWADTEQAMGMLPGTVGKFASELNKVPGVLDTMTRNMDGSNKTAELLQKTMKLYAISGRSYESITADMTAGIKEFGLNEQQAADYTTRMSVAAKAIGVPFEDFHKAITSSSAAFKMFVAGEKEGNEMTKNLQASMAGYVHMLRNSGVPMSNATEMAQNFAGAIGQMTIAQKAFISGQSGGPGGLMGAFQLDKLMDEGKIDQVMEKVQGVLRKQFGRIVTTAQAAQSQQAAEQMTRQIMILRQGPLGQFAKSDAEARRLLEAMSGDKSGAQMKKTVQDLEQKDPLTKFLNQGNTIALGSQGILNDVLVTLQRGEIAGAAGTARVTQPTLGGQTFYRYSPGETGGTTPEVMEERRRRAATGAAGGADRGATLMTQAMAEMKNLPASLKGAMTALANSFKTGNEETVEAANTKLNESIEAYKKLAAAGPAGQQQQVTQNIEAVKRAAASGIHSFMSRAPSSLSTILPQPTTGGTGTTAPALPPNTTVEDVRRGPLGSVVKSDSDARKLLNTPAGTTPPPTSPRTFPATRIPDIRKTADYAPAGQRLPSPVAPAAQTGTTTTTAGGPMGGQPGHAVPVTLAPGTAITVNFTGVCPHCKSNIDVNQVGKTPNTAATVPRHQ